MGLKLAATSGGSIELVPTNTASNFIATMLAGTGTVAVNGVSSNIVSGTAVASTSGTSIDFTSIPSWVKRVTVMLNGVSTNGTSIPIVQIGSGSVTTSGYLGSASNMASASVTTSNYTTGCALANTVAATTIIRGKCEVVILGSNQYVMTYVGAFSDNTVTLIASSGVTLSGALDRVRITTVGGTDTFDAGSINILYE
jgi:hypothetical protein